MRRLSNTQPLAAHTHSLTPFLKRSVHNPRTSLNESDYLQAHSPAHRTQRYLSTNSCLRRLSRHTPTPCLHPSYTPLQPPNDPTLTRFIEGFHLGKERLPEHGHPNPSPCSAGPEVTTAWHRQREHKRTPISLTTWWPTQFLTTKRGTEEPGLTRPPEPPRPRSRPPPSLVLPLDLY